ncbi:CocE/NonD family hydrolase [Streptomyces sp. NBC_00582]|uniref:CocE/NonD family hydrolase n=1 Tax=Streptomyces sp. NBC_00582 TaxID=2975783 RepID=UPI002E80863C|nr:CocE/NonD family hydrolase [Streptomyces sp. NBC_00582]WUB67183.1 CocE/NonD family hydrolase [Streptomyces sp. NBC_00582]
MTAPGPSDGYDTVRWTAALPGANGSVGMTGASHFGTRWTAALSTCEWPCPYARAPSTPPRCSSGCAPGRTRIPPTPRSARSAA